MGAIKMENLSSPRNRLLPQKNKIRRQQSVYKSSMYDDIENESTGVSIPNKLSSPKAKIEVPPVPLEKNKLEEKKEIIKDHATKIGLAPSMLFTVLLQTKHWKRLNRWKKRRRSLIRKEALKKAGLSFEENELEMYTDENLRRREHLKYHPDIVKELEQWWNQIRIDEDIVTSEKYRALFVNLLQVMLPAQNVIEFEKDLELEWKKDSGGSDFLNKEQFMSALYEFVDLWTESVESEEYVQLLRELRPTLKQVVQLITPVTTPMRTPEPQPEERKEEEEEVQAAETLVQSSEKQASPIDILESTIEDEFTSTQSPEPACTQSPELLRDPAQLFATIAKSNIRKLSEAERVRLRKASNGSRAPNSFAHSIAIGMHLDTSLMELSLLASRGENAVSDVWWNQLQSYVSIHGKRPEVQEDFQENGKILANEKVSLSVLEDLIEYLLQRTSGKLSYKMDSVCLEFRRTLLETFRTTDSNLDSENGWTEQKEANQTEYNESDWVGLSQVELSKEQAMNCLHTIVKELTLVSSDAAVSNVMKNWIPLLKDWVQEKSSTFKDVKMDYAPKKVSTQSSGVELHSRSTTKQSTTERVRQWGKDKRDKPEYSRVTLNRKSEKKIPRRSALLPRLNPLTLVPSRVYDYKRMRSRQISTQGLQDEHCWSIEKQCGLVQFELPDSIRTPKSKREETKEIEKNLQIKLTASTQIQKEKMCAMESALKCLQNGTGIECDQWDNKFTQNVDIDAKSMDLEKPDNEHLLDDEAISRRMEAERAVKEFVDKQKFLEKLENEKLDLAKQREKRNREKNLNLASPKSASINGPQRKSPKSVKMKNITSTMTKVHKTRAMAVIHTPSADKPWENPYDSISPRPHEFFSHTRTDLEDEYSQNNLKSIVSSQKALAKRAPTVKPLVLHLNAQYTSPQSNSFPLCQQSRYAALLSSPRPESKRNETEHVLARICKNHGVDTIVPLSPAPTITLNDEQYSDHHREQSISPRNLAKPPAMPKPAPIPKSSRNNAQSPRVYHSQQSKKDGLLDERDNPNSLLAMSCTVSRWSPDVRWDRVQTTLAEPRMNVTDSLRSSPFMAPLYLTHSTKVLNNRDHSIQSTVISPNVLCKTRTPSVQPLASLSNSKFETQSVTHNTQDYKTTIYRDSDDSDDLDDLDDSDVVGPLQVRLGNHVQTLDSRDSISTNKPSSHANSRRMSKRLAGRDAAMAEAVKSVLSNV